MTKLYEVYKTEDNPFKIGNIIRPYARCKECYGVIVSHGKETYKYVRVKILLLNDLHFWQRWRKGYTFVKSGTIFEKEIHKRDEVEVLKKRHDCIC